MQQCRMGGKGGSREPPPHLPWPPSLGMAVGTALGGEAATKRGGGPRGAEVMPGAAPGGCWGPSVPSGLRWGAQRRAEPGWGGAAGSSRPPEERGDVWGTLGWGHQDGDTGMGIVEWGHWDGDIRMGTLELRLWKGDTWGKDSRMRTAEWGHWDGDTEVGTLGWGHQDRDTGTGIPRWGR